MFLIHIHPLSFDKICCRSLLSFQQITYEQKKRIMISWTGLATIPQGPPRKASKTRTTGGRASSTDPSWGTPGFLFERIAMRSMGRAWAAFGVDLQKKTGQNCHVLAPKGSFTSHLKLMIPLPSVPLRLPSCRGAAEIKEITCTKHQSCKICLILLTWSATSHNGRLATASRTPFPQHLNSDLIWPLTERTRPCQQPDHFLSIIVFQCISILTTERNSLLK